MVYEIWDSVYKMSTKLWYTFRSRNPFWEGGAGDMYLYYRIHQGIDTTEFAKVLILSNSPRYWYYRILQGIDSIESAKVLILSNPPRYWYYRIGVDTFAITNLSNYSKIWLIPGDERSQPNRPCKAPCKMNADMVRASDCGSDPNKWRTLAAARIVPFFT